MKLQLTPPLRIVCVPSLGVGALPHPSVAALGAASADEAALPGALPAAGLPMAGRSQCRDRERRGERPFPQKSWWCRSVSLPHGDTSPPSTDGFLPRADSACRHPTPRTAGAPSHGRFRGGSAASDRSPLVQPPSPGGAWWCIRRSLRPRHRGLRRSRRTGRGPGGGTRTRPARQGPPRTGRRTRAGSRRARERTRAAANRGRQEREGGTGLSDSTAIAEHVRPYGQRLRFRMPSSVNPPPRAATGGPAPCRLPPFPPSSRMRHDRHGGY